MRRPRQPAGRRRRPSCGWHQRRGADHRGRTAALRDHYDGSAARRLCEDARECRALRLRHETTSLEYMHASIVGVSFAVAAGVAPTYLCGTTMRARPTSSIATKPSRSFKPLLESIDTQGGSHLKFDAHVLAKPWHHAARPALRLHAGVLRVEHVAHPPQHGFGRRRYLKLRTIHYEDVAARARRDFVQPGARRQGG